MFWTPIELFGILVFGHALADYPLQGDFLAKAKNHKAPIPGIPWWQALFAHSVIHAGFVGIVTGYWFIAALELVAHSIIDYSKCNDSRVTFNIDQAAHIVCKVIWCVMYFSVQGEV